MHAKYNYSKITPQWYCEISYLEHMLDACFNVVWYVGPIKGYLLSYLELWYHDDIQ